MWRGSGLLSKSSMTMTMAMAQWPSPHGPPASSSLHRHCHHHLFFIPANAFSCLTPHPPSSTTHPPLPLPPSCTVKRRVAMWVGYIGTSYKGLQIQRSMTDGQTIEEELERALYRAGGILESNFGSLEKIGWKRSSRTDKGVHSLSTVISLKLEVTKGTWENDLDGIALADSINSHLPHSIRIFSIVPVNKSFDPRRACISRTYHYLLPAEVLGITKDLSLEEVQDVCSEFQSLLSLFQGNHPFHNYTARAHYRKPLRKTARYYSRKPESLHTPIGFYDSDDIEEPMKGIRCVSDSTSDSLEVCGSLEGVVISTPRAYWQMECDMLDTIEAAHFRRILSFRCEGLETFDNVPFLRISVEGQSFMLHQIRKMVGTAIAVKRNIFPKTLIPISLSQRSRIVLPIAPSQGLILTKNEFLPFRTCNNYLKNSEKVKDLRRLEMSSMVVTRVEEFWSNVVLPEVVPWLDCSNPIWNKWIDNLDISKIPEEEFREVHAAWNESEKQENLSKLIQDG